MWGCDRLRCTGTVASGTVPSRLGFTLIEMLVALAVFGLAAMALIRLEGATLRTSGALETQAMARVVASNLAVETLSDPRAPSIGTATGIADNGGRQWRWTRVTQRTADPALVRVDIAIAEAAGAPIARFSLARGVQ